MEAFGINTGYLLLQLAILLGLLHIPIMLFTLYLLGKRTDLTGNERTPWILLILFVPIIGALLYATLSRSAQRK